MRLTRIRIDKFRAIRAADIRVGKETALVGQNSAGKTSILRALNCFLNFDQEREAFEKGQHSFTKSAFAIIDITFSEVPSACGLQRSSTAGDEVRARLRYRKTPQWQIYDGREWNSAPADFHEEIRNFITYAFIPLRRDHLIAGWGPDGLMERVVEASVNASRQRDHITPGIQKLTERIQKQSLSGLAKQLRKSTPLRGPFEFVLDYETSPDYSILLKNLILHVREGNQTVSLADSGSGTQSMAVFALYSYLAEIENSTYILGFEEPEQNLHPQAQIQLLKSLTLLGLQVIFTTHSPTMIDALDHEQVVLCRRIKSATRDIETRVTQLPTDFFPARGLNRDDYYRFHRRRNSEFFFADYVVVTESPIDAAVVSQLVSDAGMSPATANMSMLSLDGVTNLDYVFHLLRALDIASAFVVDKDYFLPYLHDDRALSCDARGYPKFKRSIKSSTVVDFMFPKAADRAKLEAALFERHSAATEMLSKVGFFCFRWSMEVDLVATATTRQNLFRVCNVQVGDQTEQELLVSRYKMIKKQDVLLRAVGGVDARSLPASFKALRRSLFEVASELTAP